MLQEHLHHDAQKTETNLTSSCMGEEQQGCSVGWVRAGVPWRGQGAEGGEEGRRGLLAAESMLQRDRTGWAGSPTLKKQSLCSLQVSAPLCPAEE